MGHNLIRTEGNPKATLTSDLLVWLSFIFWAGMVMQEKIRLTRKLTTLMSFGAGLMLVLSVVPETAALAQNYQSAEPKMDVVAPEAPPAKIKSTLQGSVQHTEKGGSKKSGRLMFGVKKGQTDTLKANVKDDGALKAQAESSIGIIGVKFVATMGRPPVINEVFPNTPADKIGLRLNDMIVAVDGVPTSGLTKDEVFDLIVGTPGTQVSLSILRNGDYTAYSCVRMDINELIDPRIRRDYMTHM